MVLGARAHRIHAVEGRLYTTLDKKEPNSVVYEAQSSHCNILPKFRMACGY
jgi:hypothetical protein